MWLNHQCFCDCIKIHTIKRFKYSINTYIWRFGNHKWIFGTTIKNYINDSSLLIRDAWFLLQWIESFCIENFYPRNLDIKHLKHSFITLIFSGATTEEAGRNAQATANRGRAQGGRRGWRKGRAGGGHCRYPFVVQSSHTAMYKGNRGVQRNVSIETLLKWFLFSG